LKSESKIGKPLLLLQLLFVVFFVKVVSLS